MFNNAYDLLYVDWTNKIQSLRLKRSYKNVLINPWLIYLKWYTGHFFHLIGLSSLKKNTEVINVIHTTEGQLPFKSFFELLLFYRSLLTVYIQVKAIRTYQLNQILKQTKEILLNK